MKHNREINKPTNCQDLENLLQNLYVYFYRREFLFIRHAKHTNTTRKPQVRKLSGHQRITNKLLIIISIEGK